MQASTTSDARLVLRSELRELARLADWIEDVARRLQFAPETSFAVQLCLEEAVANIIMYGNSEGAPIIVQIERAGRDVIAVIEDSARPFDPTQVPPRARPASLEEAQVGELGVHLMRSYASQMEYEWRDDRNRLTLRFEPAHETANTA
jgi:serine/threonine-protein kinase RsbW